MPDLRNLGLNIGIQLIYDDTIPSTAEAIIQPTLYLALKQKRIYFVNTNRELVTFNMEGAADWGNIGGVITDQTDLITLIQDTVSGLVNTTTNQTIGGTKTFTTDVVSPTKEELPVSPSPNRYATEAQVHSVLPTVFTYSLTGDDQTKTWEIEHNLGTRDYFVQAYGTNDASFDNVDFNYSRLDNNHLKVSSTDPLPTGMIIRIVILVP